MRRTGVAVDAVVWRRTAVYGRVGVVSASPRRLEIVALLPDGLAGSFRAVASAAHAVRFVRSVGELDAVLRLSRVDAVVSDPDWLDERDRTMLLAMMARHASVHVVSYTTVSPGAMRAHSAMVGSGHHHLVIKGFDDSPGLFREMLDALPADALSDALVAELSPALDRLPMHVARALEMMVRGRGGVVDVEDLVRLSGLKHRRRLAEALDRTGWQPAWLLVRASRVVRAYHYLTQGENRVRDVAVKLGYATVRGFSNEVRAVSGFLPSSLAAQLEPHDFVTRVAAGMLRPRSEAGYASDAITAAPTEPAADAPVSRDSVSHGAR